MSEMEEKLGAILNNPQMMQQIMAMAQAMGGGQNQSPRQEELRQPEPVAGTTADFDPRMIQSIATLAQQNNVDQHQQALLKALSPYLSRDRISKLERAMRAARMANAASLFLNAGGLQMLTGR